MPNGSQPQIPDHAYDDNCDDSESLAPLIRAMILFLVPGLAAPLSAVRV